MKDFSEQYLIEEYVNKKRSTHDIAKEHGCYPNFVRRSLIRFGIELRGPSEAQKVSRRHFNPTQGKERTEAECERIRDGMINHWNQKKGKP